jgi:putative transposase
VRPVRRRAIAHELIGAYRVSARRACRVVGCHRATFYYRARRREVAPLRMRLRELAAARPRFGYRRLHILLRREGWRINAKKTYRLYREEALGVRVKRRHKRASQLRVAPVRPSRPNEQWGMDFMADRLEDGRRIRLLTVEDVFTRECLAVEVDVSLTSARVVGVLEQLVGARGAPAVITVDNGSEFYSRRTDAWAYQRGVRLIFSRPGKPMDNPFIESFNGRLRDEHLNVELFFSVADAQRKVLEWQRDYNEDRPHSSLGDLSPREFAAQWQLNQAAGGEILNLETV